MKAPAKGSGIPLEGYGVVLVVGGPSPDEPYVWFKYGSVRDPEHGKLHIDEFKQRRIR